MSETRQKKLLVVVFQLPDRANGGVNSLLEIILHLRRFDVSVVTQYETEATQRIRDAGIPVDIAPEELIGSGILKKLQFSRWIFRRYRGRGIDVVHVNDIRALLHTIVAWRWLGIPVLFNVRAIFVPTRSYGWHWRATRYCGRVVALSQEMCDALRARLPLGAPDRQPTPVTYVYSIVDPKRFYPMTDMRQRLATRRQLGLPLEGLLVGFVARFRTDKQQLPYIQRVLAPMAESQNPDGLHTVFVGDYKPQQDEYARACGRALEEVPTQAYTLAGFHSNVEQYYRAVDIMVVPTLREGMARCMIEAMACAVPVISFDVTSAREILEGHDCGIVVEQGDWGGLINAIDKLKADQNLRETMGQRGLVAAQKLFGRERAVAQYEDIYDDLSGSH